jgi:hypothetical protein
MADEHHGLPRMSVLPSYAECFHAPVHGTVFARRAEVVHRLRPGDQLILVPDPPGTDVPAVWVHAVGGDVIGHLPLQVAVWLAPWMLGGGRCGAEVAKVGGDDVESWRRLLVTVRCRDAGA